MDKVEIQDFRTGKIFETDQASVEGVRKGLDHQADREDWLEIYCAVIEAKLPISTSSFHGNAIKNCKLYTDELFIAYKERWGQE
jgi:hypothetical protein